MCFSTRLRIVFSCILCVPLDTFESVVTPIVSNRPQDAFVPNFFPKSCAEPLPPSPSHRPHTCSGDRRRWRRGRTPFVEPELRLLLFLNYLPTETGDEPRVEYNPQTGRSTRRPVATQPLPAPRQALGPTRGGDPGRFPEGDWVPGTDPLPTSQGKQPPCRLQKNNSYLNKIFNQIRTG